MSSQPQDDLQRRLQKLEAEINSQSAVSPQSREVTPSPKGFPRFYSKPIEKFIAWFKSQSPIGKLAIVGVGFVLGFSILQAVFKLVSAVISLAILSILVYLGYKFFVSSNSQIKR
ncbi:hypothetical protein NUACC21_58170 [Scytonema sp. NUACC21]